MPGVGIFKVTKICYILTQLAKTFHTSYTHIGLTYDKCLVWYITQLKIYGIGARTF